MNRTLPLRSRRSDRGAALLVAVVLVAALAVIGLAVVTRASNEMQSVAAKRRYDSNVSCADAAQQLIRSQLQVYGAQTMNYTVNNTSLQTAHYDNASLSTLTAVPTGTSNSTSGGDMANRIGSANQSNNYKATVLCQNANGQQIEVDVLFSFGL
jgi:type II secretory pathway component PulK